MPSRASVVALSSELEELSFILSAAGAETVESPVGGLLAFLASGEQTSGSLTLLEATAAPGDGPPLHRHVAHDEFLYVLEGELRVTLGEAVREAPAGTFVFIAKGATHTWQTAGNSAARFLVAFTPAAPGMERFFRRTADLPAGERRARAFAAFASDAGMDVVGPPLARPGNDS